MMTRRVFFLSILLTTPCPYPSETSTGGWETEHYHCPWNFGRLPLKKKKEDHRSLSHNPKLSPTFLHPRIDQNEIEASVSTECTKTIEAFQRDLDGQQRAREKEYHLCPLSVRLAPNKTANQSPLRRNPTSHRRPSWWDLPNKMMVMVISISSPIWQLLTTMTRTLAVKTMPPAIESSSSANHWRLHPFHSWSPQAIDQ